MNKILTFLMVFTLVLPCIAKKAKPLAEGEVGGSVVLTLPSLATGEDDGKSIEIDSVLRAIYQGNTTLKPSKKFNVTANQDSDIVGEIITLVKSHVIDGSIMETYTFQIPIISSVLDISSGVKKATLQDQSIIISYSQEPLFSSSSITATLNSTVLRVPNLVANRKGKKAQIRGSFANANEKARGRFALNFAL